MRSNNQEVRRMRKANLKVEIEVKQVKSGVYTFDEVLKPEPVDEDIIEYDEYTWYVNWRHR